MRYLALFRGINVGGKNSVKMQELRELFLELGFKDVRSYIQSGNIVFSSDSELEKISEDVSESFLERFGFSVPIIYRRAEEMSSLVQKLPFTKEEIAAAESTDPKVAHLYVYFSGSDMGNQTLTDVGETVVGAAKDGYYLTEKSIRFSKMVSKMQRLSDDLTARNWRTIVKLAAMLEE
jgi:uncharacterized protein (DUF1697 family)